MHTSSETAAASVLGDMRVDQRTSCCSLMLCTVAGPPAFGTCGSVVSASIGAVSPVCAGPASSLQEVWGRGAGGDGKGRQQPRVKGRG